MSVTPTRQAPRLAVQAFWLTLSKFIAALLNIGLPIFLVRLMPQTEYGAYKEAFLFVGTATSVATFGVGNSVFYFMPRYPERGAQIALNILLYNFLAGWIPLIVLVLYPGLLVSLFHTNDLAPLATLLGVLVLFTLTSSLVQQIPTALQDVRYSTIFIVGTQLARAVLLAVAVILFRSIKSLVIASLLTQIFSIAVLFWYLHDKFPRFWTQFSGPFFKEQLAYALPYGALGVLWVIQKDLDNYFVSFFSTPGEYAIYAVGWLDVPLISLILESVVSVLIVRVSRLQQENRKEDIRQVTAAATNHLSAVQFPLFMFFLVGGHDMIVLLYTRTYERSAKIFLITILLLPLSVLLLEPIIRAFKDLSNFLLAVRVGVFIALFCVLGPVIRHFGVMGAAITAVAAQVIERMFLAWKAARAVDLQLKDLVLYKDLFKVTCVTIAAGLVAYLLRNLLNPTLLIPRIAAVGTSLATIYLAGMWVFKLPGYETLSRDRIVSLVRTVLAGVSRGIA